jgi:8-oxo-dGTP pyrophosphatase MutT (NUDIX family)
VLRHFTVAVFVVRDAEVVLHYHRKLDRWLPPGGHIEDGELPDEAALREVLEETGLRVRLLGPRGVAVEEPQQLVVPAGIQVEDIYPGHQHIDLVYFAEQDPAVSWNEIDPVLAERDRVGWFSAEGLAELGLTAEILAWTQRALGEAQIG